MYDDDFWRNSHSLLLFEAHDRITSRMNEYKEEDEALKSLNTNIQVLFMFIFIL